MKTFTFIAAIAMAASAPLALAAGGGPGGPSDGVATPSTSRPPAHGALADSPICLRDTGSLIKPRPGHCMPAFGRSYSRAELLETGKSPNVGDALQILDPSVGPGH